MKLMVSAALTGGILALFLGGAGEAQAACPLPAWTTTVPPVNLTHIFCGEIIGSNPGSIKGYHSERLVPPHTGNTVVSIGPKKMLNGSIYSAYPVFSNGLSKYSTFFPLTCTQLQIVNSALYVYSSGAVGTGGGKVGQSAPSQVGGGHQYCLNNGAPFPMQIYTVFASGQTRINTAFPL